MLLFMLSLGGIPPTAGFMGKFWLFSAAIDAGYYWLAVIGVLNSAVSLYYYLRVVVFMWIKDEAAGSPVVDRPGDGRGARRHRGGDHRASASTRARCSTWPTCRPGPWRRRDRAIVLGSGARLSACPMTMADPPKSSLGSLGALSAVGIAFVLAVVFGFLIGYGLDSWLGTSPLFMIVFFFFGVAAGVVNVIRTARAVTDDEKR